MEKKANHFSGQLGFVLAAAGSAVGVGNLWRFPYLAAQDDYFTSFLTSPVSPVLFALLFMAVTALIVYNGVEGGIEKVSRFMMPILLVLVVVIAVYSLTLRRTDASGEVRTGLQGFLYYITPHVEGLTVGRFLQILLDAMSQLFFSHSVSMGIMITYGSYVKPEVNLGRSVNQIELFDTAVALLSTILIGWVRTPEYVIGEMERNGEHFRRKGVYRVMIRYIAPVMMLILFLQSTGILS